MSKSKMKVNFFSLHIGDFLGGVISMDAEEIGAYTMLLIAHYQIGTEGLPNDDGKLAKIAKVTPSKWAKIKPAILSKFQQRGVCLVNFKVLGELEKMEIKSTAAKDKALKRWNTPNAEASGQHMPGACPEDASHKPIEEAKASSPRPPSAQSKKSGEKPSPEKPPDAIPKPKPFYRYEGHVIRLTDPDFDKLHLASGLELKRFVAFLDSEDDWMKGQGDGQKAKWWFFLNAKVKEIRP